MNILLTNDDGIHAQGLLVLEKILTLAGHNVLVIAPDGNRSGVSHSLTMHCDLTLQKKSERFWACSGTPADCVLCAIESDFFKTKPDVVISGINYGHNIGTDALYSGTCAGAREAVILGVPGIALSVGTFSSDSDANAAYDAMATFCKKNLLQLIKLCKISGTKTFVNVNAPDSKEYSKAKICSSLSLRHYKDTVKITQENCKNHDSFKMTFCGSEPFDDQNPNSDFAAIQKGYIAVSTIKAMPESSSDMDESKLIINF